MKKLTDKQLDQKIATLNNQLDKLQQQKKEKEYARKIKIADYLYNHYGISTIEELNAYIGSPYVEESDTSPSAHNHEICEPT